MNRMPAANAHNNFQRLYKNTWLNFSIRFQTTKRNGREKVLRNEKFHLTVKFFDRPKNEQLYADKAAQNSP